ncbi:MAG: hypothetical protein MR051_09140 [Lentisphaeria bacterium]|nr:hypothetical protein [Lentisphaeria bacterium]
MNRREAAALLLLAAGLSGCLPPGEPPPGNVTENPEMVLLTRDEVRERMITELASALLMHAPGAAVSLTADAVSAGEMRRVWTECVKLTGNPAAEVARWNVDSRYDGPSWQVELRHDGRTVRRIALPRRP